MAERGIWVYGVTDCGAGAMLPGFAGVAGEQVRLAGAAGLTVVASDVDLAEFGPEALHRNLEDLDWLEAVARAHHGVIDAAARLFALLPMRLATVYTSEQSMEAGLGAHAASLRDCLRRLRGRTEWGVKAWVAPQQPGDGATAPQGASSAPARDGGAGSGVAYLRRRRDALSARRDSWRGAADSARAAHEELTRRAVDTRLHPPQSPQLSGHAEAMVLNAAYLIDDDRAGEFAQAVASLNDDPGVRLELTGPWPPYSFAATDTDADWRQREGA